MFWFFEKHQSRLHYEVRRQTDGPDYELVITYPDGRQEVERYGDAGAILERSVRLHSSLIEAGWRPPRIRPRRHGRRDHVAGG